jgi:hypothetical protein
MPFSFSASEKFTHPTVPTFIRLWRIKGPATQPSLSIP